MTITEMGSRLVVARAKRECLGGTGSYKKATVRNSGSQMFCILTVSTSISRL